MSHLTPVSGETNVRTGRPWGLFLIPSEDQVLRKEKGR